MTLPGMAGDSPAPPRLGVVVVTFDSGPHVLACLQSLFAAAGAGGVALRVVVVDNASTDGTPERIADWAAGRHPVTLPDGLDLAPPRPEPLRLDDGRDPDAELALLRAAENGGFAAGVNIGLDHLMADPRLQRFWLLNPDSLVPAATPRAFATHPAPQGFGLIGGRVIYHDPRGRGAPRGIQTDGGLIDRRTGVTHSLHQFADPARTPPPDPAGIDFVSGASLVLSRAFRVTAGPMPEEYFLYYEEVAWALARGPLPILHCPEGMILHVSGASIGSGAPGRPATAFALYFRYRARMIFVRRHLPYARPGAWAYTLAKMAQALLKGQWGDAGAMWAGARGAPPPAEVAARLSPAALARVTGQPPA